MRSFCVLAAFIALLASCQKQGQNAVQPTSVTDTIPVGVCHDVMIDNHSVTICFDSLLVDCRCPSDVICITGSFAAGKFSFTGNNRASIFT